MLGFRKSNMPARSEAGVRQRERETAQARKRKVFMQFFVVVVDRLGRKMPWRRILVKATACPTNAQAKVVEQGDAGLVPGRAF